MASMNLFIGQQAIQRHDKIKGREKNSIIPYNSNLSDVALKTWTYFLGHFTNP